MSDNEHRRKVLPAKRKAVETTDKHETKRKVGNKHRPRLENNAVADPDVNGNEITGTIIRDGKRLKIESGGTQINLPKLLDHQTNIEVLDLSGNTSCQKLRPLINLPKSITSLNLSECELTTWPFASLSSLETLNISKNPLAFDSLQILNHLSSLRKLNMSDCFLKGLPLSFNSNNKLKELDLSGNWFGGKDLEFRAGVQSLKTLKLSRSYLDRLPLGFSTLSQLKECDLSNNQFDGLGLEFGEGLRSLEKLNISQSWTQTLNIGFDGLIKLKELDLSNSECKSCSLTFHGQTTQLEKIIMTKCELSKFTLKIHTGNNPLKLEHSRKTFTSDDYETIRMKGITLSLIN